MQRPAHDPFVQYLESVWKANRRTILKASAALLPLLLLANALADPQSFGNCIAGLVVLGAVVFGVRWWFTEQKRRDAIQARTAWMIEQERQRQVLYEQRLHDAFAEQEREREVRLSEYERQRRLAMERQRREAEAMERERLRKIILERQQQAAHDEQERQRHSRETLTLGDLLRKTPSEFEEAIAALLPSLGYVRVQRTGKAGDLGADVQCYTSTGELVIVQCKQYSPTHKVVSREIQTFIGAFAIHNAHGGLFVTTSDFTSPARKLALKHTIQLVDGVTLVRYFGYAQQRQKRA